MLSTANVGVDDTKDSDAGAGGFTGCYELSPGENEDTVDAGFYRPAALGDRVWSDTDADGQQDAGEPGVAGVTVELYKCVNNLPVGAVLATDVTDANGNYNFTGLMPGDYIVKFITPAGYSLTTANVGADGSDSEHQTVTTGHLELSLAAPFVAGPLVVFHAAIFSENAAEEKRIGRANIRNHSRRASWTTRHISTCCLTGAIAF